MVDREKHYNKCDKRGQSLLIKACTYGHIDIVKILLDRGSDLNKCGDQGRSSVMMACENGRTEIVKMLTREQTVINVILLIGPHQ